MRAASQLRRRDTCDGYNNGAFNFHPIEGERSRGVNKLGIRGVTVIGLGGVEALKMQEAQAIAVGSARVA